MSTAITLGAVFIVALLGLGIYQSYTDSLAQSTLAGAVALESTSQEHINGCMKDCMRNCVTEPGTETSCLAVCEPICI